MIPAEKMGHGTLRDLFTKHTIFPGPDSSSERKRFYVFNLNVKYANIKKKYEMIKMDKTAKAAAP